MPDDRTIRPFAEWLKEQRSGLAASELSEKLAELVEAVTTHGKTGTLTLRIKVAPAGKVGMGTVFVSDDITLKAPEGERPDSIFFVDGDFGLIRNDPRQLSLRDELPAPGTALGEIPNEEDTRA